MNDGSDTPRKHSWFEYRHKVVDAIREMKEIGREHDGDLRQLDGRVHVVEDRTERNEQHIGTLLSQARRDGVKAGAGGGITASALIELIRWAVETFMT